MNTVVALIPARSGSKTVKDKNIKELGGKPLLTYSIETALACGLRTVVSSDSQQYLEIAKQYGAEAFERPVHLAKDETPMIAVLKHEVPKTGADIVVLLQPTSPFRKKIHIKLALQYLQQNKEYDSVIGVERVPDEFSPYQMFIKTEFGNKVLFRKLIGIKERLAGYFTGKKYVQGEFPIGQRVTRRQDVSAWMPSGELYVFRSRNLNAGSFYGDRVLLIESEHSININSEKNFIEAEEILKSRNIKAGE